jgi:integrative and conjugative element protein (TIGR02256 family)
MAFVSIPGFHSLPEAGYLPTERTSALIAALGKNKSFSLVETQIRQAEQFVDEMLVVDVECDQVPTKNTVGIGYPERLAILVSSTGIPVVYPLRADFPDVLHRNSAPLGYPKDLCLYAEPVPAVMRSWTPETFLKRIEWWLYSTATQTLHSADQPVEGFFYRTGHELILPPDVDTRLANGEHFFLERLVTRPDKRMTLRANLAPNGHATPTTTADFIHLQLPPLVHGYIEFGYTLGELHDALLLKAYDLAVALQENISAAVPPEGIPTTGQNSLTTVLLEVPIIRNEGGAIEAYRKQAFLLFESKFSLGEALGCLFMHNGRYFKESSVGGHTHTSDVWRGKQFDATEVVYKTDRLSAQFQSAVENPGPKGTLLGVGALGSSVLEQWVRAGWGEWTIVDKDHIRPHNLVRHMATYDDVGLPKTDAMVRRMNAISIAGTTVNGITADILKDEEREAVAAIKSSSLVVDASTTLDYPRKASLIAGNPRHASIFITPSGRDGVVMLEDTNRRTTLISLEAQYYRAIISHDWGTHHLDGNAGTYYSGAGCRDISLRLSSSQVNVHAAIQSAWLTKNAQLEAASINIWQSDPTSGGVQVQTVPVAEEIRFTTNGSNVIFDSGLKSKLEQMRAERLPAETGGILLGYWDLNLDAIVLVDALAAPPDSNADSTSFVRGSEGLLNQVIETRRRTANVVSYIGEWHSHPPGASSNPSMTDMAQLAILAQQMSNDGLPVISLIVGEGEFSLLKGTAL